MRGGRFAAAAATFFLLATPAAATQADIVAQSGLTLPDRLCELRRLGPPEQAADRVFVMYHVPGGAFSLFIAPATRSVAEEFAEGEAAMRALQGELEPAGELAPPPGVSGAIGRIWAFDIGGRVARTVIWNHGRWRIKVRITVADDPGGDMWAGIECAIRALGHAPGTT